MTSIEAAIVSLTIGSLFAVALFVEPPAWMRRIMAGFAGWIDRTARGVAYRGRHRAGRGRLGVKLFGMDPLPLVTVETIAAKMRREARERAYNSVWITVEPDVMKLRADVTARIREIGKIETPEVFA